MSRNPFLKHSIRTRLRLVNLLTTVSFALIAVILAVSFDQVRIHVNQVVETQLQQTVDNSGLSRGLAEFLSRLQRLGSTFYGDDSYLEVEGDELRRRVAHLVDSAEHSTLKTLLIELQQQLSAYLAECHEVTDLILRRSRLDEDIDDALLALGEQLAERTIEVALQGDAVDYLEQLVMLLSGYRESLLEIALRNAEENHQQLLYGSENQPPPRSVELQGLALRLRTLTAAEPPIDRFGRQLIDQLAYYQHLMRLYQLEMISLGQQTATLNDLASRTLAAMAQIDLQSTQVAQRVSEQIENTIATGGVIVLGLLVLLGGLLSLAHLSLFRNHIRRPMELLSARLQGFQQGDLSTPMTLGRSDEWGQIEAVFNAMLADLVKSWSALQESERRYRNIFDNASEGIFQSTLDGEYLNINPALAATLGFAAPEMAISALTDLREQLYLCPEDRDRLVEQVRRQGSVRGFETRMRRQNGDVFWASVNSHLVGSATADPIYMEGTINDISIRRAAEESVQQLRAYLQNIVDSMPSILIGVDADCRVTLWNRQAEERTGVSFKRSDGELLAEIFPLLDSCLYLPQLAETLRSRQPNRLRKMPGQHGTPSYYDVLIYPLTTAETAGAVIHIDDVTEWVQVEEVMVQSEKMLSVGGLAAGLAHEINNPLAAILQNAQVLGRRLSPALAKNQEVAEDLGISIERVAEYAQLRGFERMLQSISSAGQRAARIVDNMLSFSRKGGSNFLPQSVAQLLERTLELAASDYDLKQNYDFRTIRIVREYDPVPEVPCEASQIQQVLLNLLKNAAQAMAGQPDPQIILRLIDRPDTVCLQVEDNGMGMTEETRKRVFEPFFTTKAVGVGTGLGLSVSYFIVAETHKGQLTVTSELEQGCCFSMELPLLNGNA